MINRQKKSSDRKEKMSKERQQHGVKYLVDVGGQDWREKIKTPWTVKYIVRWHFSISQQLFGSSSVSDSVVMSFFFRWDKCDRASHLQPAPPSAEAQVGQQAREQRFRQGRVQPRQGNRTLTADLSLNPWHHSFQYSPLPLFISFFCAPALRFHTLRKITH